MSPTAYVKCFFLEPANKAEESFRRYIFSTQDAKCPSKFGYHNAEVIIGQVDWELDLSGMGSPPQDETKLDGRWPTQCSCGYMFQPQDSWQHCYRRLHSRSDTGELVTLADAPLGAMWHADWMGERYLGPDGHALVVRTPGGDWAVDGPSSNGGSGWTRTGTVPIITVSPSINMGPVKNDEGVLVSPGYHGWLRDGALKEC